MFSSLALIISCSTYCAEIPPKLDPFFAITQIKNDTDRNLVLKVNGVPKLRIPARKTIRKTIVLPMRENPKSKRSIIAGSYRFDPEQRIQIVDSSGDELITTTNNSPASLEIFCSRLTRDTDLVAQCSLQARIGSEQDPYPLAFSNLVLESPEFYRDNNDRYGIQLHLVQDARGNVMPGEHGIEIAAAA